MMKLKTLSLFLFALLLLSSCSKRELKAPIEEMKVSDKYESSVLLSAGDSVGDNFTPSGIAYFNGNIVVSDVENDRLVVLDTDGNVKAYIGELGSAPMQFNDPGSMCVANNTLYILDMGNKRAVALDENFEFVSETELSEVIGGYPIDYRDIQVNSSGDIYYTTGSMLPANAGVYVITSGSDAPECIYTNAPGFLGIKNNEILFANSGHFTENKGMVSIDSDGEYLVHNFTSDTNTELPSSIFTGDFTVIGDTIYALDANGREIMIFDSNGDYIESVNLRELFSDGDVNQYITCDESGNFYTTNSEHHAVIMISAK